jgi:hypothetical protein
LHTKLCSDYADLMAVESSVIHVNSDDYYISAKHGVNSSVIATDSSNVILCQRIEDI